MKAGPRSQRVLLHAFSTFKLGGPQARFVQLANALGSSYRHIVVAMDNCFDAGERLESGVHWEAMRLEVIKGGALANRGAFRALLFKLKPDLLLTYNWGAIEWAAANFPRVVPHVHVEDGFGPEEASRQLLRRIWMRRVLLGFNAVPMVVASRNLQRIATGIWRLPPSRVKFVANGVDLPALTKNKTESWDVSKQLCIGTVAGLRPEKNIARLIRAFAQVRKTWSLNMIVVGDGPQRNELEALAKELGVEGEIEFTGYLADPTARLVDFDLFALSSDTEQTPIALLEAMAVGIPVVATRVGDVKDILSNVSPESLSDADDAAFVSALSLVLQSQSKWPSWIEKGREKVTLTYSKTQMIEQWRQVFDGQFRLIPT